MPSLLGSLACSLCGCERISCGINEGNLISRAAYLFQINKSYKGIVYTFVM